MKIVWLFLFLFIPFVSFAQNYSTRYYDFLQELYIKRQPSAKAQSMGGGLAANPDNDFGAYYNPALTGVKDGITLNTSFSNNYKNFDDSKFNYFGASYKIKKVGTFGISRYAYDNIYTLTYLVYNGSEYVEQKYITETHNSINTLNYSREMWKNVYAGLNLNFVYSSDIQAVIMPADIGLLIKLPVEASSQKVSQLFQIGSAYYNVFRAQYVTDYLIGPYHWVLPSIVKLGVSYDLKLKGNPLFKDADILAFLSHMEFSSVTNSDEEVVARFGSELTLLDILSLRAGYYFGNTYVNKLASDFTPFTYGFGLKIPLNLILKSKSPVTVSIDYVHLNQQPEWDNNWHEYLTAYNYYKTISLNLNWSPNF